MTRSTGEAVEKLAHCSPGKVYTEAFTLEGNLTEFFKIKNEYAFS